jgi:hypothetical protein
VPKHEYRAPSLGFHSPSRQQRMKSTKRQVSQARLSSALGVSRTLDGLTPSHTLWACFIPLPRPGFALQGFSSLPSRLASSTSRALMSFGELCLTASRPAAASSSHVASRALIRAAIRCDEQGIRPVITRSPLGLSTPAGFSPAAWETPSRPLRS